MNIPIQNLYYLLLYAWDVLDESDPVDVSPEPETSLAELFASVLNRGIDHLLRRGIDRGYVPYREGVAGVRGKLDLSATVKGNLLPRARTICDFDELTHNVLHNQILRTTVLRLIRVPGLADHVRESLAGTDRHLREIDVIPLSRRDFRSVQLHRNNRFYRFLLHVCRLVHDSMLVSEETGEVQFRDFVRDPHRMRYLFERFLRNFYRREQGEFSVRREHIRWGNATGSPLAMQLLPRMMTDISLTSADRKIVIDAKFYRETLQRQFGKATVRSSHLYQLFAYLTNLATRGGLNARVEGMLLYPVVGQRLDVSYVIQGHPVRVCAIDLCQPWQAIRQDLLALLAAPALAGSPP
jgi:5-methylcytosine-specific restriction enzyme subunit McrC